MMTFFRWLHYLYVKYKPWPRSSREIRRWSRWSIDRETRQEIMRNGWDLVEGRPRPPETHSRQECIDPAICPQHCASDKEWYGKSPSE